MKTSANFYRLPLTFSSSSSSYPQQEECGKNIPGHAVYASVARNIQTTDSAEEYPDGKTTVHDRQEVICLCAWCGLKFDTDKLRERLEEVFDR